MKRIIKGKTYNTETATLICEHDVYTNNKWMYSEDLYKTQKGTYFIATKGNKWEYWTPEDGIKIISESEAKDYTERYGNPDAYIKEWGEPEEG